jgi:acylglycerol lipase
LFPNFIFTGKIELANISRDKKEVEKYKKDPLVHPWASFTLLQDLTFKAADLLSKQHTAKFNLPILIAHGTKDSLTCPKASKMFIERVVSIDKTYQEWTGFVHELHNEPSEDRLKVITSYVDWIRVRCK